MRRVELILCLLVLGALPLPSVGGEEGVSRELAVMREGNLSDIRVALDLSIPADVAEPIEGREVIRLRVKDASLPLVLDFAGPSSAVRTVVVNGEPVAPRVEREHLVIPARFLGVGTNRVELVFRVGDAALNRREAFLYSLFVPDRARTAFPCFDQPSLRARYRLSLELPAEWVATANAPETGRRTSGERTRVDFAETVPLPTYLFSFAAGRFQVEEAERNGRRLRLIHRETNADKVSLNRTAIFDLHAASLDWMEAYSGIADPFPKFDILAIPSFQYSGMEHPGAILYRAEQLFLEESATRLDALRRANTIAHETAHLWFGDLVTLSWFDDVWMKEVFANFLAAKIVHPIFPEVDHDLRFFLSHVPAAYGIDRTAGANPIRQPLQNLNQAGNLYGSIIYHKAPIVMNMLEELVGEQALQTGLRRYLQQHRFGHAGWPDLIEMLDDSTTLDLAAWSRVWVAESGRPCLTAAFAADGDALSLVLAQHDPSGTGRSWPQEVEALVLYPERVWAKPVVLHESTARLRLPRGEPMPAGVLLGGYGLVLPPLETLEFLLEHTSGLEEPTHRALGWVTLWDQVLEGRLPPERMLAAVRQALPAESDELVLESLLGLTQSLCWRWLAPEERRAVTAAVEAELWSGLYAAPTVSARASWFRAFRSVATSPAGIERLKRIWAGEEEIVGLPLAESDFIRLAGELAVREVDGWETILEAQQARIRDPDRRARFSFVRDFLDADPAVRKNAFHRLEEPGNRAHEPWVLEGLRWLHNPLRAETSLPFLRPSLEWLPEIQSTGDIFFPKAWLDATLSGHRSVAAADIVRDFLDSRPGFPSRLRAKILQAADPLFRVVAAPSNVERFDRFEATFSSERHYENPYASLQPEARLTRPDGSTRAVPLFWDGGRTWKLRVSPHAVGEWSFTVKSQDPGLDGQSGSFTCTASDRTGGLEPNRGATNHFQYQDGDPVWFLGDTAWALFTDNAEEQHDCTVGNHLLAAGRTGQTLRRLCSGADRKTYAAIGPLGPRRLSSATI